MRKAVLVLTLLFLLILTFFEQRMTCNILNYGTDSYIVEIHKNDLKIDLQFPFLHNHNIFNIEQYTKYVSYSTDRQSPEIYVNLPNRSYIQLPVTLRITYNDNDRLYLCGYKILETYYGEEWYCNKNYTKSIVLVHDLCKSTCTLEVYAVDLAGNLNKKVYTYYIINPQITLEVHPYIEGFMSIDISSTYTYTLTIINTGTSNLRDVYLWREGCERYIEVTVNGSREISHPIHLGDLNVGDSISMRMTIHPLRIGKCTLKIIVNATDTKFNLPIKDTIKTSLEIFKRVGPYNVMVVDDPVIISILILIVTLIILLW